MRFVKLLSGIFVLATAAITLIVVMARVLRPEAVCLLYDTRDSQGGNVIAIDPTNGDRYVYRHAPAFLPLNPGNGDVSPDGSHEIYLVGPQNGPYSLYIDPKPLKRQYGYQDCFYKSEKCWLGERAPNPGARLVAGGIQGQFVGFWLDNDRIVYSMALDDQRQTLVVERIDGSDQYRLPATFDQGDTIFIRFWDEQRIVFALLGSNATDVYIWSLHDGRYVAYSSTSNIPDPVPTFSPQGNYVTMIEQGHVVLLSTQTQKRLDFKALSQSLDSIDWAPDERHLVAHYRDFSNESKQIIFGVDGTEIPFAEHNGLWSKDGRTYLYLSAAGKIGDLVVLHVDDGQLETLASDINQLYGALENGRMLVLWGSTLGTLDPGTKTRHIISDDISNVGDVQILKSGHTILYMVAHDGQSYDAEVIDADGSNYVLLGRGIIFFASPRLINGGKSFLFFALHDGLYDLEMIDLDGSNHRTLVTGLEDVERDVAWSIGPDGSASRDYETPDFPDYIVFAGKRNGVLTAEHVNLHTGDHRILAQGFSGIDGLGPDSGVGGIRFYWVDANHEDGIDVFTMDGQPMFHLKLPGDYSFGSEYQIFSYLLSPTKNVVAVIDRSDVIKLYLMAPDSSWQKPIEADLGIVGGGSGYAQAWSPDGTRFAFYANDLAGNSIRILDEKGDELHRFTGFTPGSGSSLLWTHCE